MKKLFFAATISSTLILGACGNSFIENDKKDDKTDNKQTTKKSNQNENNSTQENNTQISENEAIDRAKAVFKNSTYHDFKVDTNRSNNSEYFITFLLNDAVGTPQSSATTVNKQTGEVGNYIDDRTEEEKENYIKFIRESPKYKGSTEKLEEQARKDRTRPNDKEREPNEQSNEEQQPRNEGGTAKITPPETNEDEQEESEEETQQEQEIKNPEPKKQKLEEPQEQKEQEEPETQERREEE